MHKIYNPALSTYILSQSSYSLVLFLVSVTLSPADQITYIWGVRIRRNLLRVYFIFGGGKYIIQKLMTSATE